MLPPTWQARWTNQSIRRATPMATLTLEQTTFALPVSFCYILVLPDTNSGVSKLMAKTPQHQNAATVSVFFQISSISTLRRRDSSRHQNPPRHRPAPPQTSARIGQGIALKEQ